jgi:hypothetical protein
VPVTIQSADGRWTIAEVKSDREGKFEVRLGPATFVQNPSQQVVVQPGAFTEVEFEYVGLAPSRPPPPGQATGE